MVFDCFNTYKMEYQKVRTHQITKVKNYPKYQTKKIDKHK